MPESEILTLYTIGHSNLSAEDFLAYLRHSGITVLLGVRSAPYSRYVPHFNKSNLQPFLEANQVDYRYAGEFLGGQPKDETVYKNEEVPDENTNRTRFLKLVQYREVMHRDWYQKGIRRLLDIVRETGAKGGAVAIMCSEGNPLECHRHHLIARSLLDPAVRITDENIKILHIIKDGNIEAVEPSAFDAKKDMPHQPRLF
jgi:uncharacterized protein (DUF488 family)